MGEWMFLFLIVWFAGTFAGTALAILIVWGGSRSGVPVPDRAQLDDRQKVA